MRKRLILLVCMTAIGFSLTLTLYTISSPNPVGSRLGFAAFMALVPTLGTGLVMAVVKLSGLKLAILYLVLFVLTQIVYGVVRG